VSPVKVIFSCALLLTFASHGAAKNWKVIKADGRDYVTFANVAQFYRFPRFTQISRTVSLGGDRRGIRAQAGTSEYYINGVRFFSDYPLLAQGKDDLISAMDISKIIDPVLRPNRINGARPIETVVLDPGHGGADSGAIGPFGNEKTYALDVALSVRDQLLRAGFKVEMTRSGDQTVALEDRVAFANQFSDAVFISLHFNSALGGSGVESYALAPAGVSSNATTENHLSSAETHWNQGNIQDPANIALAAAVQGAILSRVSVFDRGVRHARFRVLRDIKIPAVLIEAGFLNDPVEGAHIATPQYQEQLGQAIAQAVATYNRAINFQNAGPTIVSATTSRPSPTHTITESSGTRPVVPARPARAPIPAAQAPN
jgi:N-acetylmuramoyl-L-alanine amidase